MVFFGFRISDFGFRVSDFGFRVLGWGGGDQSKTAPHPKMKPPSRSRTFVFAGVDNLIDIPGAEEHVLDGPFEEKLIDLDLVTDCGLSNEP